MNFGDLERGLSKTISSQTVINARRKKLDEILKPPSLYNAVIKLVPTNSKSQNRYKHDCTTISDRCKLHECFIHSFIHSQNVCNTREKYRRCCQNYKLNHAKQTLLTFSDHYNFITPLGSISAKDRKKKNPSAKNLGVSETQTKSDSL